MNYLIFVSCLLASVSLVGQGDHSVRFERLTQPDSLGLQLSTLSYSKGAASTQGGAATLEYDPVNQFPYYRIIQPAAPDVDSVFFVLSATRVPTTGYLLLYWLDCNDLPHYLASLSPDTVAAPSVTSWRLPLPQSCIRYLVVMLSNQPVLDPEYKLEGLEFTFGSFIYRHRQVFGPGYILANPEWRLFPNHQTGAEWEPAILNRSDFAYLPVLFSLKHP